MLDTALKLFKLFFAIVLTVLIIAAFATLYGYQKSVENDELVIPTTQSTPVPIEESNFDKAKITQEMLRLNPKITFWEEFEPIEEFSTVATAPQIEAQLKGKELDVEILMVEASFTNNAELNIEAVEFMADLTEFLDKNAGEWVTTVLSRNADTLQLGGVIDIDKNFNGRNYSLKSEETAKTLSVTLLITKNP